MIESVVVWVRWVGGLRVRVARRLGGSIVVRHGEGWIVDVGGKRREEADADGRQLKAVTG